MDRYKLFEQYYKEYKIEDIMCNGISRYIFVLESPHNDEVDNRFKVESVGSFNSSPVAPEFLDTSSIIIGGGAALVGNAVSGKGQGMWNSYMTNSTLNITTPYQQIKAGNYTGNITWNLVAGPSI